MKFIPILFSTEMVQAILDGRKTMTRRTCKRQPLDHEIYTNYKDGTFNINGPDFDSNDIKCPYGQVGDVLWVRETFNSDYSFKNYKGKPVAPGILYKATAENLPSKSDKWKPSLFMPKEACRIFLKVTNIRVERLQDISRDDAIAEGILYLHENWQKVSRIPGSWFDYKRKSFASLSSGKISPTMSFFSLWESINGKESLNSNPWVWVIEFERIDKPKNFI